MTIKRQIAHNTIVQLIGKVVSTILGLLTIFLIIRSLGAEKFGWYTTAIGFLQFVGIFSDFGFAITTANMLAEPKFDKEKLLNNLFTLRFFSAVLFQGLAPLLFLFFPYPVEVKIAVAITSISFFAISINQVFSGYFQQQLKTQIITAGELIGRIVLLFGVILLIRHNAAFLPFMIILTSASVVNAIYLFYKMPKIKFTFDREIFQAIFQKIYPTALCIIFNSFYLQGDRVILPLYSSQIQVGFYGAAYRVLDVIVQTAALTMGIMSPLLAYFYSRAQHVEFKKHLQMSFDLMALLLIPMMIGAYTLAEPIMQLVGGQEFVGSGKILTWLSWTILGICMGIVFGYTALAINKQKQAIWIYLSDAILSLVGYFIFIPRFGIYGAAGVTIFSEIYAGAMLMFLVFYHTDFLPRIKSLAKILLSGFIMYFFIQHFQLPNVVLSILLGGTVYIVFILLFQVISKETIKEIVRIKN
ncbi:MAG: flippase [Candidatus Magasanikbacteria bacterium]